MTATPHLIGLDWGTSSLRAQLFDAQGAVLETRSRPWGIMHVPDGDFAAAYRALVGDWREAQPDLPAIACGMVGSRGGWREVRLLGLKACLAAFGARPHDLRKIYLVESRVPVLRESGNGVELDWPFDGDAVQRFLARLD